MWSLPQFFLNFVLLEIAAKPIAMTWNKIRPCWMNSVHDQSSNQSLAWCTEHFMKAWLLQQDVLHATHWVSPCFATAFILQEPAAGLARHKSAKISMPAMCMCVIACISDWISLWILVSVHFSDICSLLLWLFCLRISSVLLRKYTRVMLILW